MQVGDLMKLKGGIEIPGDCIVVEANSVTIDESSMTGETMPMKKDGIARCMEKK